MNTQAIEVKFNDEAEEEEYESEEAEYESEEDKALAKKPEQQVKPPPKSAVQKYTPPLNK